MMGSNVSDTKLKPTAKKPATRKPAPHAPELTKDDVYLFGIGTWERSWEKMGAHPDTQQRTRGWRFCVWAPDVKSVHVIGEFNDWDEEANPLVPVHTSAIWEALFLAPSRGSSINISSRPTRAKSSTRPIRMPLRPSAPRVPRACCGPRWLQVERRRVAQAPRRSQPHVAAAQHLRGAYWLVEAPRDAPQGEPDEYGNYPGPMDPSPRSAASSIPTTTCRWNSWTTCTTWAIRILRSCRSWSIPSTAPGATRRPATMPPHRATATLSSSCTLSMRATSRHRRNHGLGAWRFLRRLPRPSHL